jgi:hypothetical protein
MKSSIKKEVRKKMFTTQQIEDLLESVETSLQNIKDFNKRKTCRKVLLDALVIFYKTIMQDSTFEYIRNKKELKKKNKK